LVNLESIFGIPKTTLYFLASLPCLFAVYDFCCYFRLNEKKEAFLKGIAFINLAYCCLSIGLAFYHIEVIKSLGWIYIITEVIIVFTLAFVELKVSTTPTLNS